MASDEQTKRVMMGFVVVGLLVVGLFAYAMSLRNENLALLERLAEYEGGQVSPDEGVGEDAAVEPPEPGPVADPAAVGDTVAAGSLVLGPSERATLGAQLGFISPDADRRVWLTVTFGDPGSARFASALAEVFEDAGFDVQPTAVANFPIRPGLYFMAADDEPPEHSNAILSALEATGYEVTSGRGYRAFYEEKKRDDPTWNGFEMAADQPFVIAIGRSDS